MQSKADAFAATARRPCSTCCCGCCRRWSRPPSAPIGAIDKLTVISTDGASSLTKTVAVERGPGPAARHRPHRRRPDPAARPARRCAPRNARRHGGTASATRHGPATVRRTTRGRHREGRRRRQAGRARRRPTRLRRCRPGSSACGHASSIWTRRLSSHAVRRSHRAGSRRTTTCGRSSARPWLPAPARGPAAQPARRRLVPGRPGQQRVLQPGAARPARSRSPPRSRCCCCRTPLLGPFVGVFLDRWSRRNSLFVANRPGRAGHAGRLISVWHGRRGRAASSCPRSCVVALNRFFLAGLSAAQPHVVEQDRLVTANSFATTAGTRHLRRRPRQRRRRLPLARHRRCTRTPWSPRCAVIGYGSRPRWPLVSFRADALGPDDADRPTQHRARRALADTARGHGRRRPPPGRTARPPRPCWSSRPCTAALYGVLAITMLLLYRNYYSAGDAGGVDDRAAAGRRRRRRSARCSPPSSRRRLTRRIGGWRWVIVLRVALAVVDPGARPAVRRRAHGRGRRSWSASPRRASRSSRTPRCRSRSRTTTAAGSSASTTPRSTCCSWSACSSAPLVAADRRARARRSMIAIGVGYAVLALWYGLRHRRTHPHRRSDDRPIAAAGVVAGQTPCSAAQRSSSATASSWSSGPRSSRSSLRYRQASPDQRTRRQAEQLHDRVAVEVGPDPGQVLLGRDPGDPLLQRVVVGRELGRLAPVAGGAVRAGQLVQPGQQRTGVGDVAAHRRVGPLAPAVPVEAQVQRDQLGDVGDDVLRDSAAPSSAAGSAGRRPPRGGGS